MKFLQKLKQLFFTPSDMEALRRLEQELRDRRGRLREQMAPLIWFANQESPQQGAQRAALQQAELVLAELATHADAVAALRTRLAQVETLARAQRAVAKAKEGLANVEELQTVQAAKDVLLKREVELELERWLAADRSNL